jgi:hypothetical protein
MILIYSPHLSSRLRYTLQFIFEDVCAIDYETCSDIQYFKDSAATKINYSSSRITENEFFIKAHGFLNVQGITDIQLPLQQDANGIKLFPTTQDDMGFDVFSAIFYFISRYEEYLPFERDKHGRFEAKESFAFKNGFLTRPIVDEWIVAFQEKLSAKFNALTWSKREFSCKPTIDIDQVFAIRGKSLIRFMKPILLNIINLNVRNLIYLMKVRLGFEKDPFDQLANFENLHKKYKLNAIYFILFSKKYSRFDINISIHNKDFRKSIIETANTADIGIHPSYHSRYDYKLVEEEMHSLSNVLNTTINSSRQHYLKLRIPNTYKSLLSTGIANDYTMGFASMPGFRAGTSHSFRFYDIKQEQTTFLKIHPFCVMDATFKTYLHYNEEQAFDTILDLIQKLKKVNGTFTPLWHNESMSEYGVWKGWSGLYEKMLQVATNNADL